VSLRMKLPPALAPSETESSNSLFGAAFYTLPAPRSVSMASNQRAPPRVGAYVVTEEAAAAATNTLTWPHFMTKPWTEACCVVLVHSIELLNFGSRLWSSMFSISFSVNNRRASRGKGSTIAGCSLRENSAWCVSN